MADGEERESFARYLLNDEQVAEIRKSFNVCDEDGSGTIERNELSRVMKELGETPTQEELEDILKDLDKNGDGSISWEEFLGVMAEWIAEAEMSDDFSESEDDDDAKDEDDDDDGEEEPAVESAGKDVTPTDAKKETETKIKEENVEDS